MNIIAVGDIMPGGLLSFLNNNYVSEEVLSILKSGDIRVGNFECAVEVPNPSGKKYLAGGNTIFIKEKDAFRLKNLGVDIVSIANNHVFDLGPQGAFKTIEVLDKMGILHCGAGHNIEEASAPAVIYKEGKSYAFIAFSDTNLKYMYEATEDSPGVNPLKESHVITEIENKSKDYDHVIVIPHWGVEYMMLPSPEVVRLSKLMIKAGASLVLGGHSHRVQSIVNIHSKSIIYCLGNFLFPDRIINSPRFTWYPDQDLDVKSLPFVIGNCPQVNEPTIKYWHSCAYFGMMAQCVICGDSVHSRYTLTVLNNNCVQILKKGLIRKRITLSLIGLTTKFYYYNLIYQLYISYLKSKRFWKKL
ncbi:MAG: CapA family protein [Prevotella sp.]|nr:CapA family protein [Prevotella sp.]